MPQHDLIDNRDRKLLDTLGQMLGSSERARIAVGYLFFSGLDALAAKLDGLSEIRLLIGNATSKSTIEQLAQAHRRADVAQEERDRDEFGAAAELRIRLDAARDDARDTLGHMDQTDDDEGLVRRVASWLREKKLHVRVYTRGRLHAKAYVFDYRKDGRHENGVGVVGSSNLTLAGLGDNTELNVVVPGNANHEALAGWFDRLWDEAVDFDAALLEELTRSWALAPTSPYDIWLKTLYTLVRHRLDDDTASYGDPEGPTAALAEFQRGAVKHAIRMVNETGGVFIADVVGLGKSFVGAAVLEHFAASQRFRPLVICPRPLVEMWETYNEKYRLDARVVSSGMLRRQGPGLNPLLADVKYRDRHIVLVDESHHFRHHGTQRYEILREYLANSARRVVLLTATPRNSSAWDVYHQLKLFHPIDATTLPIDPPDLKAFFADVAAGQRDLRDVLSHVLVRRTRRHVLRWFGRAADTGRPLRELDDAAVAPYVEGGPRAWIEVDGKRRSFPKRVLRSLRYSLDAVYPGGLYDQLRARIGVSSERHPSSLSYARWGLWSYVLPRWREVAPYTDLKRAGASLRGLVRVLLFKRLESSVQAFRATVGRMITSHDAFLEQLSRGVVPAGVSAKDVEEDAEGDESEPVSSRYDIAHFDVERLTDHLRRDRDHLIAMRSMVETVGPDSDAKLQVLLSGLAGELVPNGKCLIFTQFADTAAYLHEHASRRGTDASVVVVHGSDVSKAAIAVRFAPKANLELVHAGRGAPIRVLIGTDVLAEGLNLQDADVVVNYDLHWNPVRLIQRFGRIDRIGSEHAVITGFNFLPELALERHLGIGEVLRRRIAEIHETIGEDAAVLDPDEELNPESMYAVYERASAEDVEERADPLARLDLEDAEQWLESIRASDPAEFERIRQMPDGLRSAKRSPEGGTFVLLAKGSRVDASLRRADGSVITRELPTVLAAVRATPETPRLGMPVEHNRLVAEARSRFAGQEAKREARRDAQPLDPAQRWALDELGRALLEGGDERMQIETLRRFVGQPLDSSRLKKVRSLRRSKPTLARIIAVLSELERPRGSATEPPPSDMVAENPKAVRIVCSEALIAED